MCKGAFCFLHGIGTNVLKNLRGHLKESGPIPRDHGNCGRLSSNTFSYNTVQHLLKFVVNFATVYGLPQPAACRGRGGTAPTYLPASQTYAGVHQLYLQACASDGEIVAAKYRAFHSKWLRCLSHITKYGSTLYIGMDEVLAHYACTFEHSNLHFHFQ